MKHKMKGFCALLLACLLIIISACGSTPEEPVATNGGGGDATVDSDANGGDDTAATDDSAAAGEEREVVTITWLGSTDSGNLVTGDLSDTIVFSEIERRLGVRIDMTPTLGIGDVIEHTAILLAAGDLPDVVTNISGDMQSRVLDAGAALPLDDLLATYGQDLARNAAEMIALSRLTASDETNALYFLRGQSGDDGSWDRLARDNMWIVRWDLYRQLGHPEINDLDDLYQLATDLVALEPTNIDGHPNYALGFPLGMAGGYNFFTKPSDNYSGVKAYHIEAGFDIIENRFIPYVSDPNNAFWEQIAFVNRLHRSGLFDPESATMDFSALMEKASTGRYLMAIANWTTGGASNHFVAQGNPQKGYMPIVFGEIDDRGFFVEAADTGNQYSTFVNSNAAHPDRIMEVFNFMATPEGGWLISNGLEGQQYTIEGNFIRPTPEHRELSQADPNYSNRVVGTNLLFFAMPVSMNAPQMRKNGVSPTVDPMLWLFDEEENPFDYIRHWGEDMGYNFPIELFEPKTSNFNYWNSLAQNIMLVPGSDLANNSAQIRAYLDVAITRAVFSDTEEEFVAAKMQIVEDVINMGVEEIIEFFQMEYERISAELAALN